MICEDGLRKDGEKIIIVTNNDEFSTQKEFMDEIVAIKSYKTIINLFSKRLKGLADCPLIIGPYRRIRIGRILFFENLYDEDKEVCRKVDKDPKDIAIHLIEYLENGKFGFIWGTRQWLINYLCSDEPTILQ